MVTPITIVRGSPILSSGCTEHERALSTGLEITAGQRTMSGLIVHLTGQTFVLPVMLTGQNSVLLKMK